MSRDRIVILDEFTSTLSGRRGGIRRSEQDPQEDGMEQVKGIIRDFILREFLPGEEPGELNDETRLITGGVLDSISTLKLVTFLEDHFEIKIEAHEAGIDHLDSVHQIAALVASKREPSATSAGRR